MVGVCIYTIVKSTGFFLIAREGKGRWKEGWKYKHSPTT